jgi:hypothetical protein
LACRNRHFSIILACSGPMEITTSDLRCLYALVDEAPYWRHGVKSRLTCEYAPHRLRRPPQHIATGARTSSISATGLAQVLSDHTDLNAYEWPAGRPARLPQIPT